VITVTAKLRVNEGKEAEFIAAAKKMVAAVKANEAGKTLAYDIFRSKTDPTLFMFIESYADDEAMAAHGQTAHMAEFGGALRSGGLTAARPEIERFEPVG
jgi:quinol monooxygenase YgiN